MVNYSITTKDTTLENLVNILEPRQSSGLDGDFSVSVTIYPEKDTPVTYYGIDVLMATLALGELGTTGNATQHLRNYSHLQQVIDHPKVKEVAIMAYTSIIGKYWDIIKGAIIDSVDYRSLNGMVKDFRYVERKTGFGPDQELLNEVLSKIPTYKNPERFGKFLINVFIPYVQKKRNIKLDPNNIKGIYPLFVQPSIPRTLERINKLFELTNIGPRIDDKPVPLEDYAKIMSTNLRDSITGGK